MQVAQVGDPYQKACGEGEKQEQYANYLPPFGFHERIFSVRDNEIIGGKIIINLLGFGFLVCQIRFRAAKIPGMLPLFGEKLAPAPGLEGIRIREKAARDPRGKTGEIINFPAWFS